MREVGVEPPKSLEWYRNLDPRAKEWIDRLQQALPKVSTYTPAINPSSVAANSESVQTFTVNGLSTNDVVTVNKPSDSIGLGIIQVWVSATDTLSIKFYNHTGSPIDAGSETYRVVAVRL